MDSECDADHYCLNHMWAYNGQTESGTGCWDAAVCSGSGAFDMFDGRTLQFFCNEDQFTASVSMDTPFLLTPMPMAPIAEFKVACHTDDDCPNPDVQQCTHILWDGTEDGKSYANGVACYNWDEPVCPGSDFA